MTLKNRKTISLETVETWKHEICATNMVDSIAKARYLVDQIMELLSNGVIDQEIHHLHNMSGHVLISHNA